MNKHRVPTPEDIEKSWLEVSEVYTVSKTLYENGQEPNQRYADRIEQAKRTPRFRQ